MSTGDDQVHSKLSTVLKDLEERSFGTGGNFDDDDSLLLFDAASFPLGFTEKKDFMFLVLTALT